MIARLRALLHRPHGHDGQIEHLIDAAWTEAQHGDWTAVQRHVHALQACHPDAVVALVHTVCDRALAARPAGVARMQVVVDVESSAGLSAWLIIARAIDDNAGIRRLLARHTAEQQHQLAVALLRYAAGQQVTR